MAVDEAGRCTLTDEELRELLDPADVEEAEAASAVAEFLTPDQNALFQSAHEQVRNAQYHANAVSAHLAAVHHKEGTVIKQIFPDGRIQRGPAGAAS